MEVKLPKLGEGAESGAVVSILVKEGDQVDKGQPILELENEKAVAPIPSSGRGLVQRIHVQVGDQLSVGQVILTLGGEKAPSGKSAPEEPPRDTVQAKVPGAEKPLAPEHAPTETEPSADGIPVTSPSLRRLARELGIDLARVQGSGPGGRIGTSDIRAYIQRLQRLTASGPPEKPPRQQAPPPHTIDYSQWGPVSKKPFSPLRQTISRRMTENWNQAPHVTQFEEVDITDLNQLRKKHSQAFEAAGVKLTLSAFALQAAAATLKQHPEFNVSLAENGLALVAKEYYHIGLAVDTEQGLLVPVIRDVDKKSLFTLAGEISRLAEKARARTLSLDEMKGGTFTISNQGGIGGGFFTPIINRPEVAILGLGRGSLKPAVWEGRIVPRLLMPMTISYDHRVIDGGSAARFVVDLDKAFQSFSSKDLQIPDRS